MGRKRTQHIMARFARHFPEQHKSLMHEIERLEQEMRRGCDTTRLGDRCRALLQKLKLDPMLLPFVAQGYPLCLSTLLERVGCNSYCDVDSVILELATSFAASGIRADMLVDSINKNFASYMTLIFLRNTSVAQLATSLLGWAVQLASDGERLASRLLSEDDFWTLLDGLWFGGEIDKLLDLLTTSVGLLRACCSVTNTSRGTLLSCLRRLCALACVRDNACIKGEALQLLIVLRLQAAESDEAVVDECITILTTPPAVAVVNVDDDREKDVEEEEEVIKTRTFSEALAAEGNDLPLTSLNMALEALQRDQFDSTARLKDLHTVARLLFLLRAPQGVAAALLLLLPGALKSVFAAASGVDENVSACACTIFASAISRQEWLVVTAAVQQAESSEVRHYLNFDHFYHKKCLVEHFFLLGGVVLLEDLLTDYSDSVVVGALQLLRSLLHFSDHVRNVIFASKCMDIICGLVEDMSQDSNLSSLVNSAEEDSTLFLILDIITFLDGNLLRMLPENILGCIGTIATEARSNAKILQAAIRALTLLAETYPLAATLVLDYEYMSTVLMLDDNISLGELDAMYLIGSLNIMAAIVTRQPSSVTFEWIEIIMSASRRLQGWEENVVPGYANAFWNLVLETVAVSDDGCAYLFEDEDFLKMLCISLTRCCQIMTTVAKEDGDDTKSNMRLHTSDTGREEEEAFKLLPLLVRVARHFPQTGTQQIRIGESDLLEAIAFLIAVPQEDEVSPDILLDVVLSVKRNDELFNRALDVLAKAGPSVVPVLLGRIKSIFPRSTHEYASWAENFSVVEKFTADFEVLSGALERSEASRTHETLKTLMGFATALLQLVNETPLPFSLYTSLLSSLCNVMLAEDSNVREAACHLWSENHFVELLAGFLLALQRYDDETDKVQGAVYDTVHRFYDIQTASYFHSISLDKSLFTFAAEHVLRDCKQPSCYSLFMALCKSSDFRYRMLESNRELYLAALKNTSVDDKAENAVIRDTLISPCIAKLEGENTGEVEPEGFTVLIPE